MQSHFRYIVAALLSVTLLLASCGKDDKEDNKKAATRSAKSTDSTLLEYIPSDTPYVFTALAPMPDDVIERFEEPYDKMLRGYSKMFQKAKKNALDNSDMEYDTEGDGRWFKAISAEFEGEISLETFKRFGMGAKTTYAIFGHGLLPVLRMKLADADKFSATIKRIEKRAEEEIPRVKVGKLNAWAINGDDEAQILFAIDGDYLVASIIPTGLSAPSIELLMGAKKPANSMAGNNELAALMKAKGYLAYGLTVVDFRKIAEHLIDAPSELDKELLRITDLGEHQEHFSDVCKQELYQTIGNMPRIVGGLTSLSDEQMGYEMLLEVRDDWASEMSGFAAPVPGLGMAEGIFSFGWSFDIISIQKFMRNRLTDMRKSPFECEQFAVDDSKLDAIQASINNPAMSFVQAVRGFNFTVEDVDIDGLIERMEEKGKDNFGPGDLDGMFSGNLILAAKSTSSLLGMASMFSPGLASLNLEVDGDAVEINSALPMPAPGPVYAAMSESAFVFSMGKMADKKAERLLKLPVSDSLFFSYSMDMERYTSILEKIMSHPEIAKEMDAENMSSQDMQELFGSMYGMFGKITANIRFRKDGVVMEQQMTFQDP